MSSKSLHSGFVRTCQCTLGPWIVASLLVFLPSAGLTAAGSPEDLLREVQGVLQSGRLDIAQQKLEAGLSAYPTDPRIHNALGIVSAQQENFEAAETHFRNAVELAPGYVDALLNLGRLYQQTAKDDDKLDNAIAVYENIASLDPGHLEANYQLAVLLQRRGNYEQSQKHLDLLPEAARQRAQALSIRCANLAALGDTNAAEQAARTLLQARDLSPLDVTSILPVLEKNKQTDLTIVLLEGLSAKGMASPEHSRALGLAYEQEGKLEEARKNLEKAAPGFQDNLTPLLRELARVAYQQKDYKGTLGYLAHARDLEPNDASIHFFFGMTCLSAELIIEARNSLQKAVELAPEEPYYNYALGSVLSTQRNANTAVPYLEKFLAMKPGHARGKLTLGVATYRSGDYERAQKEFEAVAVEEATAPVANYFLGRIAVRNNEMEKAQQFLEEAIRHAPEYSDAYADLGLVFIRRRDYDAAAEALDKAIEIDPGGYRANLNLLLLYQRTDDKRQDAQKEKFERLQKEQQEKLEMVMRSIEVRPY